MKLKAFGVSEKGLHLKNQDSHLINIKKGLFAVADGVTVSSGDSEKASKAAVSWLEKEFEGNPEAAIQKIHEKVSKMGGAGSTTLTFASISKNILEVGHVGDSTLYLIRESARKVTENDSVKGSNALTQVVGSGEIKPHTYKVELKSGDIILLATDGVSRYVSEGDILDSIKHPLEKIPSELIRIAREKRKLFEDDKTIVVVRYD